MSKISIFWILIALLPLKILGQERILLRGKVSTKVDVVVNGFVLNINTKKSTAVSEAGFFEIPAKAKDTLMIGCLACAPKSIVLEKSNLNPPIIEINVDLFDNELKEVVVNNTKKIKVTSDNTQKYVDKMYFDDLQSSPVNPIMAGTLTNGVNFVRLFKDIQGIFRKKRESNLIKNKPLNFYKEVTQRFPQENLEKNLNLKADDLPMFFHYCENDKRSASILTEENDFLLMDFLITKNKEFKTLFTFEK